MNPSTREIAMNPSTREIAMNPSTREIKHSFNMFAVLSRYLKIR